MFNLLKVAAELDPVFAVFGAYTCRRQDVTSQIMGYVKMLKCATRFFVVSSVVALSAVSLWAADKTKSPLLTIGSKAPSVDVEHWVSDNDGVFEHTTTLESGKVYVVEFWATWCGPCIRSMPRLAEVQARYPDRVQVISVSNEDLGVVNQFLERKVRGQEGQTYADLTKTYCLTTDPDQSVKDAYFRAAGRTGIPCAFIVGKTGLIEWIGHPMKMDEALEKVVSDSWDRDEFAAEYEKERSKNAIALEKRKKAKAVSRKLSQETQKFLKAGEYQKLDDYISVKLKDEAYQGSHSGLVKLRIYAMVMGNLDGSEEVFNQFLEDNSGDTRKLKSMLAVVLKAHSENGVDAGVLESSLESAAAIAAAEPENASSLSLYARLLHADKNIEKAIKVQEAAVENAGPRGAMYEKFLKRLKEEQGEPAS